MGNKQLSTGLNLFFCIFSWLLGCFTFGSIWIAIDNHTFLISIISLISLISTILLGILVFKIDIFIFILALIFTLIVMFGAIFIVPEIDKLFDKIWSLLWLRISLIIFIISAVIIFVEIKIGILIGKSITEKAGLILGIVLIIMGVTLFLGIPIIVFSNRKKENIVSNDTSNNQTPLAEINDKESNQSENQN